VELCGRLRELLLPSVGNDVTLGLTYMTWEGPVARLVALLAERMGRTDEADARFHATLARTEQLDAGPYLARTRYEYGRALQARGDHEKARGFLGSARSLGARLGLTGLVALADRRLAGLGSGTVTPLADLSFSMAREGDYWTLAHAGAVVRLKDSLGLQYLARLVAEPGREVHVLELVGGRRGGEAGPVDAGDAGELLDDEARDSYRRRLEDLEEELKEAESFSDPERASRLREEIELLGAELGRAVGLGGRSRRAGSAAERARSAVQRRIKNALERVEEHDRALAAYLARAVKTGNFCVFRAPA
jgi:tetratricopeptide (TPR) repeat protein